LKPRVVVDSQKNDAEPLKDACSSEVRTCSLKVIGPTLDNRDLHLVRVGDPNIPGVRKIWLTAGQHPSEKQGLYAVEGLLDALLDPSKKASLDILKLAVFYVVCFSLDQLPYPGYSPPFLRGYSCAAIHMPVEVHT
jgi:murein tripeptide amidase MpaA